MSAANLPLLEVVGPGNTESSLVALIAGARHRILVEAFALIDAPVIAALQAARRHGVDVRVMLEPTGVDSTGANGLLAGAGIRTHTPNPSYLTHMDAVVVDATAVAVLTTPLLPQTLGPTGHSYLVIDRDRYDVLQAASLFYDDWLRRPVHLFGHNLVVLPDSASAVAALIGQASARIELYTPGLTASGVLAALQAARQRGVVVRVLTLPGPNENALRPVAAQGDIRFRDDGGGTVLVIDRRLMLLGSMDLSAPTLQGNRELGVVVGGQQVVSFVDSAFFSEFARGTVLAPLPPRVTYSLTPSVRVGGTAQLTISTVANAQVAVTITYPPGSSSIRGPIGISGRANAQGFFSYRWVVPRGVKPGRASMHLAVQSGGATTAYTAGFTIAK